MSADMVKLVDMPDLGSGAARRVGSSPIIRTFRIYKAFKTLVLKAFFFFIPRLLPGFRSNRISFNLTLILKSLNITFYILENILIF